MPFSATLSHGHTHSTLLIILKCQMKDTWGIRLYKKLRRAEAEMYRRRNHSPRSRGSYSRAACRTTACRLRRRPLILGCLTPFASPRCCGSCGRLRPAACSIRFASAQDGRPGRLPWTVYLLHSLAADVMKEEGGQLIVTVAGSDDGLPAKMEDGEKVMHDFSNLQAVFKHYCRSVTNDSSVIRFNADVTSGKYADRGIKPSDSVEKHVNRLLRAVYFASSDEASRIEQDIRAQRPGFPMVSTPTEPTAGSGG